MTRRIQCAVGILVVWLAWSGVGHAQDPAVVDIFKDGFYGGLAGALVGAAALAFTDDPGDNLDFIAIGAGVGVIAGTAYGIYTASQALAVVQPSGTEWNFPSVHMVRAAPLFPAKAAHNEYRVTLLKIHF